MRNKILEIKQICASTYFDIELAPYTTFRIGGKALALCNVKKLIELKNLISYLNSEKIPYVVLGKGSNVLISDSGFYGAVLRLKGKFEKIIHKGNFLIAGAGVRVSSLLRYCIRHSIKGLEFLAGIPGTVGGAVSMNAGVFGKETCQHIEKILILKKDGEVCIKDISDLKFSYRNLSMERGTIILYAWFKVESGDKEEIKREIRSYLEKRRRTQPIGFHSAGCIFKNPRGNFAGRLIEKAGLKGLKIGGAVVSNIHANFIINEGNAKASDVLALIKEIKKKINDKEGINLETEIRFIGFDNVKEKLPSKC